jgi:succinoglycan biosynthesis protein ExoM
VAVCVCTYKRPEVLRRLLERLVEVAADARALADVTVAVADDDPARSAEAVCTELAPSFEALSYVNSASGNIAVARNHVLELGLATSDWLAIIDDDCLPEPDWVRQLLLAQRRHGTDCVTGACEDVPPPGAPAWLGAPPFLEGPTDEEDGAEREVGHLKNTLIRSQFLREHDIRFDVEHGKAGCEDVMFFYELADAGMTHRFAKAAVVREEVPMSRATLRYQLRRRLWYGNTEARTSVASGRSTRHRVALRGLKLTAIGAAGLVARAVRGRSPEPRVAAAEVLQGLGRVLGAAGVHLRHR